MIPFSILDLAPICKGSTAAQALRNSLDLAQHAERWGYYRYWLAEHHGMPGIASAATSVVIGYIAGGTHSIRVGSGGVMLPNHAPLVIAEEFGTLASLYPGRIDLGIGRAPGADPRTAQALNHAGHGSGEDFPEQLNELQGYFAPLRPGQRLRAVPGMGLDVPIWLLGSSLFSAQLAAQLGLPYAFASHFAPAAMLDAIALYRARFRSSLASTVPRVMIGVNVLAADTDAAAHHLFTSQQQAFANLIRGTPSEVPPPVDDIDAYWTEAEKAGAQRMLSTAIVGSLPTVEFGLKRLIDVTKADELILTGHIYDHASRLHSYELVNKIRVAK